MPKALTLSYKQIKAARAILGWSQDEVAEASGLSIATVRKLEAGTISPRASTNDKLRDVFENAGLEFLEPNGARERPSEIKVYDGFEGMISFFDDIYLTAKKKGGDFLKVCESEKPYCEHKIYGNHVALHIERMLKISCPYSFKCLLTEDKENIYCEAYSEYRYLPKEYIDSVSFYVYDDKYAILGQDLSGDFKISVITSKRIAESFRRQFYSMWDKAIPLTPPPHALQKRK